MENVIIRTIKIQRAGFYAGRPDRTYCQGAVLPLPVLIRRRRPGPFHPASTTRPARH